MVAQVRTCLTALEATGLRSMRDFYGYLFSGAGHGQVTGRELREMFPPTMGEQTDRFWVALLDIASRLDGSYLGDYLADLGRTHRKYGVRPEHYSPAGESLIHALRRNLGHIWTVEAEDAWRCILRYASHAMISGSTRDEAAGNPPWWPAEIIRHEVITSQRWDTRDIALITVRTDAHMPRLPYLAGQYVPVQFPRKWPKVWRPYSPACAPRQDGTIDFHIRAISGGLLSRALVHDAQVGDRLVLGPAAGGMHAALDSPRNLLLIAGGTGVAPIMAIAESGVSRHRDVALFYGAKIPRDLYAVPTLREVGHPQLRLICVTEDGPHPDWVREGKVAEVAAAAGDWVGYEAYISGPEAMVDTAVKELRRAGILPEHIRHDDFDDALRRPGRQLW